ncbi:hypothetical protein D9M68_569900 [compost metagenome]
MGSSSAKGFIINIFADSGFHEVRTGQKNRSGTINNHRFITHDGQVGSSGYTGSHNGRNLNNSFGRHHGIISKHPAKMFFIGKYLILHGQVHSGTIHQINYRKPVFHSDFLCAQILFRGHWKPGAGLNGGIVGNDHTLPAAYITYAAYYTCSRAAALLGIHAIRCKSTDFEPLAFFINKILNSFACQQLSLFFLPGSTFLAATSIYLFKAGI